MTPLQIVKQDSSMKRHGDWINNHNELTKAMEDAFYMKAADVYSCITQHLPPETGTCIIQPDGRPRDFMVSINSYIDGTHVLSSTPVVFQATEPQRQITIHGLDICRKLEKHDIPMRRQGLGTIFVNNIFNLARRSGFSRIKTQTGDADGILFWTKMGFSLDVSNPAAIERSVLKMNRALRSIAGDISVSTQIEAKNIIDNFNKTLLVGNRDSTTSNQKLLTLRESLRGQGSVGEYLLRACGGFSAVIDPRDSMNTAHLMQIDQKAKRAAERLQPLYTL